MAPIVDECELMGRREELRLEIEKLLAQLEPLEAEWYELDDADAERIEEEESN